MFVRPTWSRFVALIFVFSFVTLARSVFGFIPRNRLLLQRRRL